MESDETSINLPEDIYKEIITICDIDTLFQLYHSNKFLKNIIDANIKMLNKKFLNIYGIKTFYELVMWYYHRIFKINKWENIQTLQGQLVNALEQLDYYYNPNRPGYKYKKDLEFINKLIIFLNKYGYDVDVNNLDNVKKNVLSDIIKKQGKYNNKDYTYLK